MSVANKRTILRSEFYMKIMFLVCIAIIVFAVINYDKMSYKKWYERCVEKRTGYYWGGIPRNKE